MNITVIEYGGIEHHIECESFEFRTNTVDNWIRIDGSKEIHDVATIKSESKEDDIENMLEHLWNDYDEENEGNAPYDKNCWKSIYTSNSTTEPEWRKNQYGLGLASNDNDYTWAKELVDRVKK